MFRRSSFRYQLFMFGADLLLTAAALGIAAWLRAVLPFQQEMFTPDEITWSNMLPLLGLIGMIWVVVFTATSVYDVRRNLRTVDEVQTVALAVLLASFVLAGTLYLSLRNVSRYLFLYFCLVDLLLLISWRLLVRFGYRMSGKMLPHPGRRVLIIGAGVVGRRVEAMLANHRLSGIQVVGFLDDDPKKQGAHPQGAPVVGTLDDVWCVFNETPVDEIIVALPMRAHQRLVGLISALTRLPVRLHVVPDLFDLAFFVRIDEFSGIPMIGLREPAIDGFSRLVKRAFDLALATVALVVAAPVMGLIAIAVKLDSAGPVIFKQQRVGENGRLFWMYKFRSMCQDAEERLAEVVTQTADGKLLYKQPQDPRVTRVGHFIRATSLDELPQLINVLKGEMSLVGPRPEMPWLVDQYDLWQRKRFSVPQGITGWWQVNGRSDKPMQYHTAEDLYYIQNYSLWLDILILGRTFGAILKRKGAY